jgi:hypothetical protein
VRNLGWALLLLAALFCSAPDTAFAASSSKSSSSSTKKAPPFTPPKDESMPANQCLGTGGDCFTVDSDLGTYYYSPTTKKPSPFIGMRSDPGGSIGATDVWGVCRYVDNSSASTSFFVPFSSALEWGEFLAHPPSYAVLSTCARPFNDIIRPDATCAPATPEMQSVDLPYGRTGDVVTRAVEFGCVGAGSDCDGGALDWKQQATATYVALNSDVDTPSWKLKSITYAGIAPKACVPGACGAAAGVAVKTAPKSNLCAAGKSTAVTTDGTNYMWGCLNSSGGKPTACSAPVLVNAKCGTADGVSASDAPVTGLCKVGNPSAVGKFGSSWTWTCTNPLGGPVASCSAPVKAVECIPQGQSVPAGQTQCPTNECFFYVTGSMISGNPRDEDGGVTYSDGMGPYGYSMMYQTLGETGGYHFVYNSIFYTSYGWTGYKLSNLVGEGDYPDSYVPFKEAADNTFDGIAIGKDTHIIIYDGANFTGNVLLDIKGPAVINSTIYREPDGWIMNPANAMNPWPTYYYYHGLYGGPTSGGSTHWLTEDWSTFGPMAAQFPPSSRHWSDQVGATDGDMQHWPGKEGVCNSPPCDNGPPGGSLRVICDTP